MAVDRCVCCGAVIPEGGWVCLNCRRFTVTAGGRRSGKTAHILSRAAIRGAVVIVKDENRKTQLEEQAKRMGTILAEKIADRLIANGVTAQRWVPVTERLPEKEGSYLVCSKTGKVYTSHYYTKRKISEWYTRKAEWSHPNVTHWMPLPEPPKGE